MLTAIDVILSNPTNFTPALTSPADLIKKCIKHNNTKKINEPIKTPKFPCSICNFDVKHNDKAIFCTSCEKWAHIRCTDISVEEYRKMQMDNLENPDLDETWLCYLCTMHIRAEYSPFIYMSNNQLINMNSVDSMNIFDMLPDDNVFSEAFKTNCLRIYDEDDGNHNNEIDEDIMDNINCKYYTCDEFFNHENSNSFNIVHSNVNGLRSHAENINEFIGHKKNTTINVFCLTETSLPLNETDLPTSIKPEGFTAISTGTETQKGGATIFVKECHDFVERDDLMIQTKEFETVWIEIKTDRKDRNIVIGCIYRHPHYNNLHDFK